MAATPNIQTIRLSLAAEKDIEAIWHYTRSEWGEEQANKYIGLIEKGFVQLLDNPHIGKARPDIKAGYRVLQVKKHLIFYRIGNETIDIVNWRN